MTAPRIIYYPAPSRPMTPEELTAEFAKLGRNDPLWLAIMQLLQARLANAIVAAANSEATAAGRLDELLNLQQEFAAYRDSGAGQRRAKAPPN